MSDRKCYKVGEMFKMDNIVYRTIINKDPNHVCFQCDFKGKLACNKLDCTPSSRPDNKFVYFKTVNSKLEYLLLNLMTRINSFFHKYKIILIKFFCFKWEFSRCFELHILSVCPKHYNVIALFSIVFDHGGWVNVKTLGFSKTFSCHKITRWV